MDDIFRDDEPAPAPDGRISPQVIAALDRSGKRGKTKGAKDKPGTKRTRARVAHAKGHGTKGGSPTQDLSGLSNPRPGIPPGKRHRPSITAHQWQLLLAAYRSDPGRHAQAATRAGVGTDQARKLWHHGGAVPGAPESGPPLRDIVEQTAIQVRAELQFRREAALQGQAEMLARFDLIRARADSVHERVEHLEQARAHRGSIAGLVGVYGDLVASLQASLGPALAEIYSPQRMRELIERSPSAALKLVEQLVKIGQALGTSTEQLVKLERTLLGEVTERTEQVTTLRFETENDALEAIQRAQDAAARMARGLPAPKIIDTTGR